MADAARPRRRKPYKPSMTREQFVQAAVRWAERRAGLPAGWWGTRKDAHGPDGQRVLFVPDARVWSIWLCGVRMGEDDSRDDAIRCALHLLDTPMIPETT